MLGQQEVDKVVSMVSMVVKSDQEALNACKVFKRNAPAYCKTDMFAKGKDKSLKTHLKAQRRKGDDKKKTSKFSSKLQIPRSQRRRRSTRKRRSINCENYPQKCALFGFVKEKTKDVKKMVSYTVRSHILVRLPQFGHFWRFSE